MKVLLINTSEEENGILKQGLELCSSFLHEENIETEILNAKNIHPCTGCGKCLKRRRCMWDGAINEIANQSNTFDAMIVGSDVMYGELSKNAIDFMECLFRSSNEKYLGKVGAILLHTYKGYPIDAYNKLNSYYSSSNMPVITNRYYNTIHTLDDFDKNIIHDLSKNMSWLLKCIELGKKEGIVYSDDVDKLDEFMKGR